jgi:mono/diheme cytochrome c family protein
MKYVELTIAAALCLASAPAATEEAQSFPKEQIAAGAELYSVMPPWGDFFKPDQFEALWAYVMAGER